MLRSPFEYRDGDDVMRGELALPDTSTARHPGVLVVHEGGGINDHPKWRAGLLAELGYVALACDLYGNGELITDPQRRSERMGELRGNPTKLRRRVRVALDALAAHPGVDRSRLAAIGYCFGGLTVLELARSGAPVAGVVSFHGILSTSAPAEPGAIRAKLLVCHGVDDPFAPPEQVATFVEEMRRSGCDWQLITYANAAHGFTRKDAASTGIKGVVYEERADRRSWTAMKAFFDEIFAR